MADKRPAQPEPGLPVAVEHDELHPVLQFLTGNLKVIALVVGGLLLVVALASGYQAWRKSRLADAREELGKLVAASGENRLANLQAFADQAPSAMRTAVLFELASAAVEEDNQAMALEAFRKLRDTVGGELRATAELGMANALLATGKPDEALQGLKAASGIPEAYKAPLARARAQAAEAAGRWDEAIAAYEELRELEPGNAEFMAAKATELRARQAQAGQATPAS
jgi:tetratricopeptide (TPR) repeat protein